MGQCKHKPCTRFSNAELHGTGRFFFYFFFIFFFFIFFIFYFFIIICNNARDTQIAKNANASVHPVITITGTKVIQMT